MAMLITSDKPVEEWTSFIMESVSLLENRKVRGVAIVALLREETEDNARAVIGYHNMALKDKQEVVSLVQADVIKQIIRANLRELLQELEEDEDG